MTRNRVFVTGLGMVSPLGHDLPEAFAAVLAGRSAVREMVAPEGRSPWLVAPVDLDEDRIPRSAARNMARVGRMAVVAAEDALVQARLKADAGLEDCGVYLGSGMGGADALEEHSHRYVDDPSRPAKVTTVPKIMVNGPAAHVSMQFGIRGPTLSYSMACASSSVAIGEAFRAVRDGYVPRAVAGGSEAQLNSFALSAWAALRVLADAHTDGPGGSCRPFDLERTGMVLGEGATLMVLETEASMRSRGVEPVAEIVGYGASSDAHRLTEPDADGQIRAMRLSLADAGLPPEAIGYLNAHATGTLVGDRVEAAAVRRTFGEHTDALCVSSTKGAHGHLVGGAGALEAALTIQALRERVLPPTTNLRSPDPECPIRCPAEPVRAPEVRYAMSNSFAFGGANTSLVFGRVEADGSTG